MDTGVRVLNGGVREPVSFARIFSRERDCETWIIVALTDGCRSAQGYFTPFAGCEEGGHRDSWAGEFADGREHYQPMHGQNANVFEVLIGSIAENLNRI